MEGDDTQGWLSQPWTAQKSGSIADALGWLCLGMPAMLTNPGNVTKPLQSIPLFCDTWADGTVGPEKGIQNNSGKKSSSSALGLCWPWTNSAYSTQ